MPIDNAMNTKVKRVDRAQVLRLFRDPSVDHALVQNSIECPTAAYFVNRSVDSAALLVNQETGFGFLAGNPAGSGALIQTAIDQSRASKRYAPFISLPTPGWSDAARELASKSTSQFQVATFHLADSVLPTGECRLSAGWRIETIAAAHCGKIAEEDEIFDKAWKAAGSENERLFGCCVVDDATIGAYAFAGYPSATLLDVTVFTREPYRRKGLAEAVCRKLIETALVRQMRIHWGTTPDNAGSIRLAEALGFVREPDHEWLFVGPNSD